MRSRPGAPGRWRSRRILAATSHFFEDDLLTPLARRRLLGSSYYGSWKRPNVLNSKGWYISAQTNREIKSSPDRAPGGSGSDLPLLPRDAPAHPEGRRVTAWGWGPPSVWPGSPEHPPREGREQRQRNGPSGARLPDAEENTSPPCRRLAAADPRRAGTAFRTRQLLSGKRSTSNVGRAARQNAGLPSRISTSAGLAGCSVGTRRGFPCR